MENYMIAATVLLSVTVLLLIVLIFRIESTFREAKEKSAREIEELRTSLGTDLNRHMSVGLNESFSQVYRSLEGVQRGLGEMNAIARDTKALRDVLTNVKNRGVFGEIFLGKLLSDMLAPNQYIQNFAVSSDKTVEFAVKLPGSSGESVYLPIDSKFPIESYHRIVQAEERVQLEEARKDLYRAVKEFAKQIAAYIQVPKTTHFALMFLPTEGLYAEVVRNAPLIEEIREKYSIIIVGATTLSGFLTSLLAGFQTLALERKSMKVWEVLTGVKREFLMFETALQRAGQQAESIGKTIDILLSTRMKRMSKALRDIEIPDEFEENESEVSSRSSKKMEDKVLF